MDIKTLLILIPALPLAAAALTAIIGPRLLRSQSHWLVILALLGSTVCSGLLLSQVLGFDGSPERVGRAEVHVLWRWAYLDHALDAPAAGRAGDMSMSAAGGDGAVGNTLPFHIDVVLRADALTAVMLSMVTFVSLLVAIYSVGYMHSDRSYWRFFAYIGLFVFSMTMLVSVSNFVLLFVFWEAVGLCSYLLIGFWYQKPEAAAAGKKAFLVNRVGDFGYMLALFLIWTTYGSLNFHDTLQSGESDPAAVAAVRDGQSADEPPAPGVLGDWRLENNAYVGGVTGLAICLLLLLGASGKSAQFPLHVWLPDAMEGPTPVSALIHAATMVTAGVYMVVRCTPLFMASPDAQLVVSCIGALTALLAGLIALTQFDLKRVLAYSTISQLGYMFLALGTGTLAGVTAGMFHLFTHAFFKALLFLGAGSVMHAMGNVIDMRRFGGLRKIMPVTHATFAIGCLALAGILPLSGFWSKDAVIGAVHDKVHELQHEGHPAGGHGGEAEPGHAMSPLNDASTTLLVAHLADPSGSGRSDVFGMSDGQRAFAYQVLYYSAIVTALLTAIYTFRAFFLTFYGEQLVPGEAAGHAHESPATMTIPLVVLAVFAAAVGLALDRSALGGSNLFAEALLPTPSLAAEAVAATTAPGTFHIDVAGLSTLVAFGGAGLALYLYLGKRSQVRWVRDAMDFRWFTQLGDVESVSRLKRVPWIRGLRRAAHSAGLGWLVALVGYALLLPAMIVSLPLLLLSYVSPYKLSSQKFYFDEIYQAVVVRPLMLAATAFYAIDRWLIDGTVDLVGRVPPWVGRVTRQLQTGQVQHYALAMALGVVVPGVALLVTAWMFEMFRG